MRYALTVAAALAALTVAAGAAGVMAGEAPKESDRAQLGSPDFRPSAEHPYGWRGDGSGRFPGATPPMHWGRVAKCVQGLRAQATRPKAGETGKPIPDGVVREWLVLGPVPTENEQNLVKTAPGGAELGPDNGEKAGDIPWKRVETDSSLLDFYEMLGAVRPKLDLAFAHAYVYSPEKAKVRLVKEVDGARGGNSAKVLLNGAPVEPAEFQLEKGWNRLLLRVPCGEQIGPAWMGDKALKKLSWFVQSIIYGAPGSEYATESILWTARVPGWSIASPVVVGGRIFVLGDMRTLSCLDKASGRIIWARTATFYHASTEEERTKNPEIFNQITPMVSRLAEMDKGFASGAVTGSLIGEKCDLEKKIDGLMRKGDETKYCMPNTGEGGYAPRTPVTDGRSIFVSYHPCLTICYDLDGNMKWAHNNPVLYKGETHGWYGSPRIVDGKVIVIAEHAIALDVNTGKVAWQFPGAMGASILGAKIGGRAAATVGSAVRDAGSGELLASLSLGSLWATPVIDGDMMYSARGSADAGSGQEFVDISRLSTPKPEVAGTVTIGVAKLITIQRLETNLASPLYHDGLVYVVDADGVLSVVDVAKREVVYQKYLDLDNGPGGVSRGASGASPALAGKYIYIFGNQGTCVVIEPGRTFKQVAKNRVEFFCLDPAASWNVAASEFCWTMIGGLEQSLSCPVFEGNRMYYRGTANLYCIGEK